MCNIMTNRSRRGETVLLALAVLSLGLSQVGAALVEDNFDSQTVGQFPTGWTNDGLASTVAIDDQFSVSASNSLEFTDTVTNNRAFIYRNFTPVTTQLEVDFDVRVSDPAITGTEFFVVDFYGNDPFVAGPEIRFTNGSLVVTDYGSTNVTVAGGFPRGVFKDYNIVVDFATKTYTLKIDDVAKGTWDINPALVNLRRIRMGTTTTPGNVGNVWVDNIYVDPVPEPASSGLLLVTGLLGCSRRFVRRPAKRG